MIFLILSASFSVFAAEKVISTGVVYDPSGKEKMFTYERYQDVQGDKILGRAVYKDLKGDTLVEEKIETLKGELVRYDMDQKQLKQKAWIDVKDGKATFNLKKFRKRNYPQTITKPENFIVGLQIVPFVKKNWKSISEGKEHEVKLGVWHRQEAITFDIKKDSAKNGQMVVKMQPASMFIKAVVSPIYFTFDGKTQNLISYKGRTTPKVKRGRSYHDFDALTKYRLVEEKASARKEAGPKVKSKKK